MVQICAEDTEFRKALAAFLIHEQRVKVEKLTEKDFEQIGDNVRNFMTGDEAEITSALWFRAARHQRLRTQFEGLFQFWFLINVWLFWRLGFQHLLSWQAAVWIVVGTAIVWSVVGYVGASMEVLLAPLGVHYKLVRGLKYLSMYIICRPIFNLLFTGRF